jgi:hypothetical protein
MIFEQRTTIRSYTMKIAINACYGGFSLSEKAYKRYCELAGKFEASKWDHYFEGVKLKEMIHS